MAFDQNTRNRLQNFVSDARTLLTEEFTRQLQNDYGMDPATGEVTDLKNLTHLEDTRRQTARLLRETLDHYQASSPSGGPKEALGRILREQAFTVLNRLCALRMAEARGILIESIGNGYNSKGFQLYARVAGTALGETGDTYRCYLFSLFDELAIDLVFLFDRYSLMGRLFPRESALLDLLEKINEAEITPLWAEDETLGWIYQYFNSKEERKRMRDESQAPRNSRELAVRNQFFTPRYVVEFLTDNTLGRIWYEMIQGKTRLKEQCRYLVRRPNEIFLAMGEEMPELEDTADDISQEELLKQSVYIPFRPMKDPRDIKILDPACGSGHFLLYTFDLLETIYSEAWDKEPNVEEACSELSEGLKPLRETYETKELLMRDVPRLVIEHNLHGVDIDPRAVQIAGLSLWLRAQRTWKEQNVKSADRPRIRKSNIVCAEPMPGEKELLREFTADLKPRVLGQFLEIIFEKMKLAGEAGSLLKIEEEIEEAVEQAREEFNKELLRRKQATQSLFPELEKPKQQSLFDFADLPDKTRFWRTAEQQIIDALQDYAEQAEVGDSARRRLFAEDAAKGFAFIDLFRKRFDVVLMNPPFGECAIDTGNYIKEAYPNLSGNILCAFIERAKEKAAQNGSFGAIYDRTVIVKQSYTGFRQNILLPRSEMFSHLDLGWGVLDANVETAASVFLSGKEIECMFIDIRTNDQDKKGERAFRIIERCYDGDLPKNVTLIATEKFISYPNSVLGHDFPAYARRSFLKHKPLVECGVRVVEGHTFITDVFLRYWWEIPLKNAFKDTSKWQRLYNGGEYSRYVTHLSDTVVYGQNGEAIKNHKSTILRNINFQQKAFVGYGKRGEFLDAHALHPGFVSTVEGKAVVTNEDVSPFVVLALLNSKFFQSVINLYCGQHKHPGYVNIFPTIDLSSKRMIEAGELCEKIVQIKTIIYSGDETRPTFLAKKAVCPFNDDFLNKCKEIIDEIDCCEQKINELIYESYKLTPQEISVIEKRCSTEPSSGFWFESLSQYLKTTSTYSYIVGIIFGRWDICYATNKKEQPGIPRAFDPLPVCSPGMLQNSEGLPAEPEDVYDNYPLRISWSGIMVNEEGHREDIVGRVREVIEVIWKDKAGTIEQESCELLGVSSLRDFFNKPAKFFDDHLKRYSKSRRQAPIYWPLSTASGYYILWLYYHRLTDQTLYTCVNEFVEPKLKQISEAADELRRKTGLSRQEERELESLSDLELELKDFSDELLRLAKFWKPNLNDGVQITAAPLWKLFQHKPWQKKLKQTWEKLKKGDYDWAHLAYSIWPDRVIRASHKDRSYAIAHDLEADLWEEIEDGTDRQGNPKFKWVPKELSEVELLRLIKEKTGK